ncbi:MAG TPA: glycosyltransferase family 1 protein [Gemmatimonadaceae bacterium]|nr:glycosyltransferase family 1 protein [Gemmatimonadaceae bacterium]
MRVAVNLLYMIPGVVGGTETYARGLVGALPLVDEETEYIVFLNREAAGERLSDAPNVSHVVCPVTASRRAARYAYEQTVLPAQLAAHRVDLLHSLGYIGPLVSPCRHLLTVPDLNFVGHRDTMSARRRLFLRAMVGAAARRADHLLTISEFSRDQIVERYGLLMDGVTVTHLASRPASRPPEGVIAAARQRHGLPTPYVVAFGSTFRHKNLTRLVEAFAVLALAHPHQLVLVGRLADDVRARITELGLEPRVTCTGFVPDGDVAPIVAGAELLVFPSLYEGFGLPLLDAQALDVPVAASRAGALPEVGGDGAIYFDPERVSDIAAVVGGLLGDQAVRHELARRGAANVLRFSWERTARLTCETYHRFAPRASRRTSAGVRHA